MKALAIFFIILSILLLGSNVYFIFSVEPVVINVLGATMNVLNIMVWSNLYNNQD